MMPSSSWREFTRMTYSPLRGAGGFHGLGGDGDHLGVGGGAGHADRVSVALDEFAEAERARLLVAPDGPAGIAAEGLGIRSQFSAT